MKNQTTGRRLAAAASIFALVTISACSSSDSSGPANPQQPPPTGAAPVAYNGPGSKWDADLREDGSFRITRRADVNSAIDMTIDGNYVRSAAGFVLMTVDSATGQDAPAQGDTAWAIEAEGYALMLYTQGDNFIPMIKSGVCPSADFNGNWVIRNTRGSPDLQWASDLASMTQVALTGYVAGGLFLGLAYFDLPYHLMAMLVLLKAHVRRERKLARVTAEPPASPSMQHAATSG